MKVVLTRGDERVEIDGDDDLISDDLCYQGTFERTVKKVTDDFYRDKERDAQGRKG